MASIIPIDPALSALQAPIVLLRAVRDAMTAPHEHTQEKLDSLTRTIAENLHADVCSIYLARPGDIVELFTSYGLKQTSVHVTRLRVGEGLVGEIAATARALNLAEPQTHPKFAYRPETGEELYHSFVGVPLLHSHKVVGVLVVQTKTARNYSEELVEILHTVAMVIAELVMNRNLVDVFDIAGTEHAVLQSLQFSGQTLASGVAYAPVVLHRPKIVLRELVSDQPEREENRFHEALAALQQSVDALISGAGIQEGSEHHDILETYRLFSQDRGWIERIAEAIHTGLTAEAAVRKVQEEMHARLSQVASPYIQERILDLEDLSERLLYHLAGMEPTAAHGDLPAAFILVAKALGPAELLEYDAKKLKGILIEEGSPTAHVSILARMMDVPMVGKLENIASLVQAGDMAVVHGDHGTAFVRPPEDVVAAIVDAMSVRDQRIADFASKQTLAPITADGIRVSLNINVGLFIDAAQLSAPDIDGVGLFRTELPYLTSKHMPTVEEQTHIYRDAYEKAAGKRVIFRSFDIGGDKQVPYIQSEGEENPAMGWRATRIGLDRPGILRQQFRAFIRACNGRDLWVMFPFIAEIAEFEAAKAIFMKELDLADSEGFKRPSSLHIGTMIEIPSLLFQLDALMRTADFVSIGSNDLLQFFFAADRGTAKLNTRYDPLCPAVIRMLRHVTATADAQGVSVGFCGDLATKPLEAMVLLACGVRTLSMPASSVGSVKAALRALNVAELRAFLDHLIEQPVHSLREQIENFVRDHGVII